MVKATEIKTPWLSGAAACRAAGGISKNELMKRVALGEVRTLVQPGATLKFNVEDCEKIAKEMK